MRNVEPTSRDIIEWLFKGMVTILLGLSLYVVKDFNSTIKKVEESINKLNINIATIVAKDMDQSRRMDRFDARIERLERRNEAQK